MWTVIIKCDGVVETSINIMTWAMNLIVKDQQLLRAGSIEVIYQGDLWL